jgi:hypothetical protein
MKLTGGKPAHLNLAAPAYASSLYGKGWFYLKLPFLINVYYTKNHLLVFMVRKRTKIEWGNMARSCKKCGFFVSSPTSSTKDIGYCLYFDLKDIEKKESLRKLKLIDGEKNGS